MTARVVRVAADAAPDRLSRTLAEPAAALAGGALVAFPTETVYGLGADALDGAATARIFASKGRPADNPLIVHLADASWLDRVAVPTPLARRLAARFWPGPLTLVLAAAPDVPAETTAGLATVAVRVPDSVVARTLIALADTPVAAPSANRSGAPSPTSAAHVLADLGERVQWVVDGGACTIGIESTVVDATGETPVILREGAVTREMLATVAGGPVGRGGALQRSPGTRHRHYQPHARVRLAPMGAGVSLANELASGEVAVGLIAPPGQLVEPGVTELARPRTPEQLGQVLYAALRRGDDAGLAEVVVEAVPEEGVGRAIMDRLRRASEV